MGDNKGNKIPGSLVCCDADNVIMDIIKKSEYRKSIICRIYDAENMKTNVKLSFGFPVKEACLCDMMENRLSSAEICENSLEVSVGNFEIVTVEIVF